MSRKNRSEQGKQSQTRPDGTGTTDNDTRKASALPQHDPHAAREAGRYDNPIVSREHIMAWLETVDRPVRREEVAEHFGLQEEEAVEALRRRLIAMTRDGQLYCNRKEAYGLTERMSLKRGRISGHRDGFGFVIPEDGSDDLFVSPRQMRQVFDGDTVLVRVSDKGWRGKKEAAIVEVLERAHDSVVGRLYQESGVTWMVPDNPRLTQDIRIPEGATLGAGSGQYVTVRITQHAGTRSGPLGEVTEILGDHMDPGMEVEVALRTYNVPHDFPEEALREAASWPADVVAPPGRIDCRHLPLMTIDGEDARDFDDAVYCEKKRGGGWRLFVAIADVSHYVAPGSALDSEAFRRGTSVYFPSRVVPMLPEALSNGLCSLNPDVDRLCMICEVTVSSAGRLSGYRFYEAIMRSRARLTYTQVAAFLEDPDSPDGGYIPQRHPQQVAPIEELYRLYRVLVAAREQRGAIDFDTVETRILFNKDRKIDRILPVQRNDAHKLIEECMLCANVATARFLEKHEIPALYRVHEGPTPERLEKLRAYIGELGLQLGGGNKPSSSDYQALAQDIRDRPDHGSLQVVMLRSLSQAVYHPLNQGHFGLGYEAYTHFTSPIRRYPDLLVHRAIRTFLRGDQPSRHVLRAEGAPPLKAAQQYALELPQLLVLGEHCSMTERRADEATRDVMAWLKCEYLQDRVGEVFPGTITAVTAFGLFVELVDLYVEGLVHVSALQQDYYHHDATRHQLVGERTGRKFHLGDEVTVQVVRVNLDDRKVDLEVVSSQRKQGDADKTGSRTGSRRDAIIAGWKKEQAQGTGAGGSAPGTRGKAKGKTKSKDAANDKGKSKAKGKGKNKVKDKAKSKGKETADGVAVAKGKGGKPGASKAPRSGSGVPGDKTARKDAGNTAAPLKKPRRKRSRNAASRSGKTE